MRKDVVPPADPKLNGTLARGCGVAEASATRPEVISDELPAELTGFGEALDEIAPWLGSGGLLGFAAALVAVSSSVSLGRAPGLAHAVGTVILATTGPHSHADAQWRARRGDLASWFRSPDSLSFVRADPPASACRERAAGL